MGEELSDYELKLQESFLAVECFDEYLERYHEFTRLPRTNEIFAHQMKLMQTESKHNHRKKELLIHYERMRLKKEYENQLIQLVNIIEEEGIIDEEKIQEGMIQVCYQYPKGKKEAIQNELALQYGINHQMMDHYHIASMDKKEIEHLILFGFELFSFSSVDLSYLESELYAYLFSFHRLVQLDWLIYQLQPFTKDYRSLKSITIPEIKELIRKYQRKIKKKRDQIYQDLIVEQKETRKWKHEQDAFIIVHQYFEDTLFQYQPEFLNGQSLDIYIPSKKIAIEYQGKQHYEEIEFFGGKEALEANQKRDQRKKIKCEENHIQLIYWYYFEPVTKEWFEKMILPQFNNSK